MSITEIKEEIAASLWMKPRTEVELYQTLDICKNMAFWVYQRMIQQLETDGAIYYKGEKMNIYKEWAISNLKDYELDFRTEKEKELDGMTDFAKDLKKKGII